MLEIRGLSTGYAGTQVLRDVDLSIEEGSIAMILGRNGAGKTTLLKSIAGLLPAWSGSIALAESDLTRIAAHNRIGAGVAYVPQGREIFPRLSVEENLLVGGLRFPARIRRTKLERTYQSFPVLAEKRKEAGGGLSGGQQQILALARALMSEPKVLLLDEPSEGIQPSIVMQIAEIVGSINAEQGLTVVLVEQNLDFARRLGGMAHLMVRGAIARHLSIEEFAGDRELQNEYMGV